MIKKLTKHGNSLALVLDRGVLDLLETDNPLGIGLKEPLMAQEGSTHAPKESPKTPLPRWDPNKGPQEQFPRCEQNADLGGSRHEFERLNGIRPRYHVVESSDQLQSRDSRDTEASSGSLGSRWE